MFIVIFLIWLLLNAHFAFDIQFLEIVLFGLALTSIIYLFLIKFTKWDFKMDVFFMKNIHLFIAYGAVLFVNVLQSNFKVLGLILKPGAKPKPEIVKLDIDLDNEILRVIAANSITLTPGTITVTNKGKKYIVHCLKEEYIEGFENSTLVKILKRMEGKK